MQLVWAFQDLALPQVTWSAFPCTPWGSWSGVNAAKSPSTVALRRTVGRLDLQLVRGVAMAQDDAYRWAGLENPWGSKAFDEPVMDFCKDWHTVRLDQCMVGLTGPGGGRIQKPTRITANAWQLTEVLAIACSGDHTHEHALGCPGK